MKNLCSYVFKQKSIITQKVIITSKYQNHEIVLSGNIMKTSRESYLKIFDAK